MLILGVDPGIQVTGFAILQVAVAKKEVLDFGIIETKTSSSFEQRLKKIYDHLVELIEKYSPNVLALEEVFYSRNVQVALKLGHARGVTMIAAANYGISAAEYSPREIKQALTGNGNASKQQVQQMVVRLLNLQSLPSRFDMTDAMAVAYCHSQRMKTDMLIKKSSTK